MTITPADHLACLDLVHRYHGAIDRGVATRGLACFAPDAHFEAKGQVLVGADQIGRFLTDREAQRDRHTVHAVVNPLPEPDTQAAYALRAVVMLYAMREDGAYALDRVLDTVHEFERNGDAWLISARRSQRLHS